MTLPDTGRSDSGRRAQLVNGRGLFHRNFYSFKLFNHYAPFNPPPFSSPAKRGGGERRGWNCLNVLNDLNDLNYLCLDSHSFKIHFCASSWRAPNLGSASGKPYSTPGTRRCSGTTSPSGMSLRNDDRS